jgi:hypothetical protein
VISEWAGEFVVESTRLARASDHSHSNGVTPAVDFNVEVFDVAGRRNFAGWHLHSKPKIGKATPLLFLQRDRWPELCFRKTCAQVDLRTVV